MESKYRFTINYDLHPTIRIKPQHFLLKQATNFIQTRINLLFNMQLNCNFILVGFVLFLGIADHSAARNVLIDRPTSLEPLAVDDPESSFLISRADSSSYTSDADFKKSMIAAHNFFRKQHSASTVTWNNDRATSSHNWSKKCQFAHSVGLAGVRWFYFLR
jgi:hypothetical protein